MNISVVDPQTTDGVMQFRVRPSRSVDRNCAWHAAAGGPARRGAFRGRWLPPR